MDPALLGYEVKERIAVLTLNRPEKKNALNPQLIQALHAGLDEAGRDPSVRVVLLKARGDVFCSGADLEYLASLQDHSLEENLADSRLLKDLFVRIYTHEKMVISQVEGPALGGGCGLATVCDLCYCAPRIPLGYPEVRLGFLPALVSVFLIRRIGESRARELLLTGETIESERALQMGLITGVQEKNRIGEFVWDQAIRLARKTSAQSIAWTKGLIAGIQDREPADSLEWSALRNAQIRGCEDFQRGLRSFLDGEKIIW